MPSPFNFAGRIAHAFVHNRAVAILLFFVALFLGVFSYAVSPKQYNPEVTLPVFQISIDYPGASAEEVEQFVTRELEEKISDLEGVDKISSISIEGGKSIVTVEFLVGESLESARVKIQSQIMENLNLRQGTIGIPLVKTINPDDVPLLEIGFSSLILSQNEVRKNVLELSNRIQRVSGVSNISVHGGESKALKIEMNADKMKNYAVSIPEIIQALQNSNIQIFPGSLKNGTTTQEIELQSTISLENISALSITNGVRMRDIATITEGFTEKTSFVQVAKHENEAQNAVLLSIAKRKGENGITVPSAVMDTLQKEEPWLTANGISFTVFRDDGKMAATEIGRLGHDLSISILIVILLLVFFLGLRESLIVAIAIPLTLGLVFFVGYLFHQTINRITLFALILALGLLVDDAIVVVENIHRHLKNGDDKKMAIVNAVNEVGVGLFLCTFSAIIVFLPLTQITGMMGPYMGPLSFFVPVALAISLIVAYALTPFLSDILLVHHQNDNTNKEESSSFFDRIAQKYAQMLSFIFQKKWLQKTILWTTGGLFLFSLLVPVLGWVHFKMLPKANRDQYYVYLDADEETDLPAMQKMASAVGELIAKDSETRSVEIFTGEPPVIDFNGLYKGANMRSRPFLATLRVNLSPHEERSISSEELVMSMRKKVLEEWYFPQCGMNPQQNTPEVARTLPCPPLQNLHIKFLEDPPGPPVSATLLAKVKGENAEIREQIAQDMEAAFAKTEGVVDTDTSRESAFSKTIYEVNYDLVRMAGVSVTDVASSLRMALSPERVMQYFVKDEKEMAFIELSFPKNA
ncbi:MAG: efflux RND transporter permease subunit, partial [Candidatus Peregrinibacteria bacterium]